MFVFFSCNAQNAERRKMGNEVENAGTIKWHPGFYGGMKLQVSVSANKGIYSRIAEEDNNMCEALRELFKDEIDGLVAEGEARGVALGEARGEARALDSAVEKLADHYMSKDPELVREEALRMASAILR